MTVHSVTDATFETEVLRSELPVLIDLYADWCQPCKQLSPIVEEVARELEGKLKVVKIDVDRSPGVAQAFRVQSIPMLVVIAEGQVANAQMGVLPKATILEMVQPFLPAEAGELSPADLAQLLTQRRAVAVDIRDAQSYGRTRIPGAAHVPLEDVTKRASELKASDGRVRVLYSRTTDEAKDAAHKLREVGVDVAFLTGGFLHWEADGLAVERPE
ncbi:MAG: thioredoxin [Sandaracinaceae bacterium]